MIQQVGLCVIESNPYNNNNNIMLDSNDDINIYYLYNSINTNMIKLRLSLQEYNMRLQKLINDGGPKPVKAQCYDSGEIKGSRRITPENVYYNELKELVDSVAEAEGLYNAENQKRLDLIDVINQIAMRDRKNIELQVFIEVHIKHVSLYDLSKRLYRKNESGERVYYNYSYLRQLNSQIKLKMKKEEGN